MSLSSLAWSVLRIRVLIHDKDIRNSLYLKDVSVIMRVGLDDAIEFRYRLEVNKKGFSFLKTFLLTLY